MLVLKFPAVEVTVPLKSTVDPAPLVSISPVADTLPLNVIVFPEATLTVILLSGRVEPTALPIVIL